MSRNDPFATCLNSAKAKGREEMVFTKASRAPVAGEEVYTPPHAELRTIESYDLRGGVYWIQFVDGDGTEANWDFILGNQKNWKASRSDNEESLPPLGNEPGEII